MLKHWRSRCGRRLGNLAIHSEDGKGVFLDTRLFASERVPMFRIQFCGGEETLVLAVEINIVSSVHASPA